MAKARRASAEHRAEILRRERELALELFRPHTDAEVREAAAWLDHANALRDRSLLQALPDAQLQLTLTH